MLDHDIPEPLARLLLQLDRLFELFVGDQALPHEDGAEQPRLKDGGRIHVTEYLAVPAQSTSVQEAHRGVLRRDRDTRTHGCRAAAAIVRTR